MFIEVELSVDDLNRANAEADRRQQYHEKNKTKPRNNGPSRGSTAKEMHSIGCIGELAVARFLGMESHVFSNKKPVRGSSDLPGNIEVKTRSKYNYDLLIQLDDDPNKLFVLTAYDKCASHSTVRIIGWQYGFNIMNRALIREFVRGRPCYAIPQGRLNPPETLQQELLKPQQVDRELSTSEAWLTYDKDEMILNFSEELLATLGWKPGDTLAWSVDPNSKTCSLKKVNDR